MEPKPVGLVLAKDSDLDGNESSLGAVSTGFLSPEEIRIQVKSDIWKDEEP